MAVVTEVRSDEAEHWSRRFARKVVHEVTTQGVGERSAVECARRSHVDRAEGDHIGVTLCGVVDDGVEIHEGVVPVGVLVAGLGERCAVAAADAGVRTVGAARWVRGSPVSCRVVAHIPGVLTPRGHVRGGVGRVGRIELVGDGRRPVGRAGGCRVHATVAIDLTWVGRAVRIVGSPADVHELAEVTVRVREGGGGLSGDLGDVVVEAHVTGGVVILKKLAFRDERPVEVGRRRAGPERGGSLLVLEVDDEDVVDRSW